MGRDGPFEAADRRIGVQPDDELGPEAQAVFKQRDVADVQEVEAAVGEDDGLAGVAPLAHAGDGTGHATGPFPRT